MTAPVARYLDDKRVRLAAFDWLDAQVSRHGDALPWKLLLKGFELEGQRIPLVCPKGIFKPAVLPRLPLSIATSPSGPYDDRMGNDGQILYSYRGTDPQHPDNVGLRRAMFEEAPLVYLHGLVPGKYVPVWPVFIVGDDPRKLMFTVKVDDKGWLHTWAENDDNGLLMVAEAGNSHRDYVTSMVQQRLHQRGFRERVLDAYHQQCALCRLRHAELLDAAHIIPDGEPNGEPVVNNGISLCKLHHAAFDSFFLGIRPDFTVEVRPDILEENDGPMLLHGLQDLHGSRIIIPRSAKVRPDAERLEIRYERFRAASEGAA